MNTIASESDSGFQRQLAAARAGDEGALAQLFQQQWDSLWQMAASQLDTSLQPKHSASDVLQDSFLDARRSIADFRGNSPAEFQAWLRTILNNNVRDAWRHFLECQKRDASRERPLESLALQENLFNQEGNSPSQALHAQEQQSLIAQALDRLPPHYRIILRMRYWEHKTFEEIGQALGKSADAVRQTWYRAVDQFSRIIDEGAT